MPHRRARLGERLFYRRRHQVAGVAALLAVTAGFVNGVALLLAGRPVSHLSGTIARLSQDLALGRPADLAAVLSVVGAFLVGAAISGAIVGGRQLLPGRRYGAVLIAEGGVLAVTTALFPRSPAVALMLAALACGLQNGMASSFYGVVVRTTHLSGLLTDLAVGMGQWVARHPVAPWRMAFQASVIAGFAAGGTAGAWAAARLGPSVLVGPAVLCLTGGALHVWAMSRVPHRERRRARHGGATTLAS